MGTGLFGAAMIAWAQSHIEGVPALQFRNIAEGMSWRWHGTALPLAGTRAPLILGNALNAAELKSQPPKVDPPQMQVASPEFGSAFVVSDGERVYSGLPVNPFGVEAPLLVFHNHLPPSATDLKILQADAALTRPRPDLDRPALLCFTPGTCIDTPEGAKRIEDLGPGDKILTRDNGAQEITWMGHRRMTGARLFALPQQRPIRIRAGALGPDGPVRDLRVSPDHRVVLRSAEAQGLWGEREVLVRASDLVGQPGIAPDTSLTETYYIHLMLDQHEVITADGLEVESFHPGLAGLDSLQAEDRQSLLDLRPDLRRDPQHYGAPVRRLLSQGETAILGHALRRR